MDLKAALVAASAFLACGPPMADEAASVSSSTWFKELELGEVGHRLHAARLGGDYPMPENLGPGVGLVDYDSDGDLDLYLVNGGNGPDPAPNRLLRQESNGRFVDVTEASSAGDEGDGMGVAAGDLDGDGDVDLFVTNYGPDRLLVNNGDGTFSTHSVSPATDRHLWSTSAAFCDVDVDGLPDIFVTTYVDYDPARECTDPAGRREYCGPLAFDGVPDLLLANLGDAEFADVSAEAGLTSVATRGLGVVCHDLDGDGLPDIFVANDGEKNDLWTGRAAGRFEEQALLMGTAVNMLGEPEGSMGIALGDVDGDLDVDLLLSHLDRETNTLYRNLGPAGFEDATAELGIGAMTLPLTGFGAAFIDPDRDGDLDLVVANGKVRRGATPASESSLERAEANGVPPMLREYAEPNLVLENQNGSFFDGCVLAGSLCSRVEVGRGLATGDIDRDGAPDLVLANCAGPARVYRNTALDPNHWIAVRAARPTGSDVLGSNVVLRSRDLALVRPVVSTTSYQSASDPVAHFGLGPRDRLESVTVDWPGGASTRFIHLPVDHYITAFQGPRGVAR